MTGRHDLGRDLGAYLDARATNRAPDGLLDATLRAIATTDQRPAWIILERWLPAHTIIGFAGLSRATTRIVLVALLLLMAIAAAVIIGSQRRLPPPFGLARPGLIVFSSGGHLFTMDAKGSGRTQLTFGPVSDYRATYSPDGTLIAYLSVDAESPDALQPRLQGHSIAVKVVSADGGPGVSIADRFAPSDANQIAWSPDSRRLAFAAAAAGLVLSAEHVYVADADRPGATELGPPDLAGRDPIWSPDGRHIAFKNARPVDALWVMDADGANPHPVTKASGSTNAFLNAQWSPDGTHLLYLAGTDEANDVWTVNADGSDERNISRSPEDEWWPTWSPDGTRIAYVRFSPAGDGSFVVCSADGSSPSVLPGPFVDSNPPVWSPDGTKLFGYEMANGVEIGIVVYDVSGATKPISIPDGTDGTWQRLAPWGTRASRP